MSSNYYDSFVKEARNAGFTDDQIDFIWDWVTRSIESPVIFTHEDNYSKPINNPEIKWHKSII